MKYLVRTLLAMIFAAGPAMAGDDYDMKNVKYPVDGIMTGGQPSLVDVDQLARDGVKVIINLRPEGEYDQQAIREKANAAGIKHITVPVAGAGGITIDNARRLDEILKEIGDSKSLIHCASGNRAGALLAVRAYYVQGMDKEESLAFGKAAGMTSLAKRVENMMK